MKSLFNSAISLKIKLPASIVIIVIISLTISTIISLNNFNNVVHAAREQHLENAAKMIGENIAMQVGQAGRDMIMTASLPGVLQAVEIPAVNKNIPGFHKERASLTALFERIMRAYGYYNALYVVNEYGEYIVGTSPTVENLTAGIAQKLFAEAMQKKGFSIGPATYSTKLNGLLLPIFLEIVYNGYGGALVSSLNLQKIVNTSLQELPYTDVTPIVFACDDTSIFHVNEQEKTLLPLGSWLKKMKTQVSGVMEIPMNDSTTVLGFYQIPQTNLYAVAISQDKYMLSASTFLRNSILTANIFAVLFIMFCVYYFTIPVTRDISYLSQFAKAVTERRSDTMRSSKRKDELGHLFESIAQMVNTLKDMVIRSEAATKAKSDFLARMSHEIRTPMNGILGMTYLALRANPDEKQKNYLQRIDTAAKTLLGVINDILDFSKIEAEKMDIDHVAFRVSTLLTSMRDMLQPKCDEKGITLTFSVADDVPKVLVSDPLRFTQVCINLCSNAIKFTPKGDVHMHISIAEKQGANFTLLTTVKDTGIGMTEEAQEHIFDSFSQADGTTTRKYGGTGLGLAISKSLAHLLGGDIWVESELHKGSTFYFTIQAQEGLEADLSDTETMTPPAHYTLPKLNILLAEDNEINQEIALEILKNMGTSVTLAHNGAEAVALWEKENFDVILMDIQMPTMDGLTAAQTIRQSLRPLSASVPIIAMTAHAMVGDKEKSLEAGMNDHITKPLNVDELYNVLAFWGSIKESENIS